MASVTAGYSNISTITKLRLSESRANNFKCYISCCYYYYYYYYWL